MSTIALVTGDRYATATEWEQTIRLAFRDYNVDEVVVGAADGIDSIAESVAKKLLLATHRFPANWGVFGKSAGPIRNTVMLNYLVERMGAGHNGVVLAFHPDIERSKGTRDMVSKAHIVGLHVVLFERGQ